MRTRQPVAVRMRGIRELSEPVTCRPGLVPVKPRSASHIPNVSYNTVAESHAITFAGGTRRRRGWSKLNQGMLCLFYAKMAKPRMARGALRSYQVRVPICSCPLDLQSNHRPRTNGQEADEQRRDGPSRMRMNVTRLPPDNKLALCRPRILPGTSCS